MYNLGAVFILAAVLVPAQMVLAGITAGTVTAVIVAVQVTEAASWDLSQQQQQQPWLTPI